MMGSAGLALSWSGGKDSALALWTLRGRRRAAALITTVTEIFERISHHGVRRALLARQASYSRSRSSRSRSLPAAATRTTSDARGCLLCDPSSPGSTPSPMAIIFLEDVRSYRENQLASTGRRALSALEPRHHRPCPQVRRQRLRGHPRLLDPRSSTEVRRPSLRPGSSSQSCRDVDPCGENGEFHTFVHAGPIFTPRSPAHAVKWSNGTASCSATSSPTDRPRPRDAAPGDADRPTRTSAPHGPATGRPGEVDTPTTLEVSTASELSRW